MTKCDDFIEMEKLLGDGQDEAALEETVVPVVEFISIPQEAIEMKRLLVQLAKSCEEKIGAGAKESIKTVGAELIRTITTQFGDRTNFEAIAAVTNVLLYILDESEKRSMSAVTLMRSLPEPKSIN